MTVRRRPKNIAILLLTAAYLVGLASAASTFAQEIPEADDDQAFARFVRTRWVLLDEENGIDGAIGTFDAGTGALNPASSIRIELYNANAQLVSRVGTGADGRFRIGPLESGLYQCIAQSGRGFLAFSLFTMKRGERVGQSGLQESTILVQAPRPTEDKLEILSAAVPPTFTQLNSILRLYYGRETPAYLGQLPTASARGDRANLRDRLPPQDAERPLAAAPSAVRAQDVLLRDGNRMVGRLYAMDRDDGSPRSVRGVYVHIIRDDRLVGPPIPVNEDGVFEVELFDGPGAYSIVAAGSGGFGASGFYARRAEENDDDSGDFITLAGLRKSGRSSPDPIRLLANAAQNAAQNVAPNYQFTMSVISDQRVLPKAVPAANLGALADGSVALPEGGFADSLPGDGTGDRALAGVGGGGGGGWAALLLGGGLAAGITAAALSDNSNNPVINNQPVSPSSPFSSQVF